MRPKRDDSINPIIGKNRQLFQCLHACSALREAGCGFYAASFAVSGWFPGRTGAAAGYRSLCCHLSAINVHRRLMRGSWSACQNRV